MITLNLLSPEKKRDLRLIQLYLIIKNLIVILLIFTIIVAIILLITKMALQNHFNKIIEDTTLTAQIRVVFNQDIKIFNQRLVAVEKIQKDYISWTNFLINFTNLVPDELSISSLNINRDENVGTKIFISGFAKTREKLLALKNNLENSPLFFGVDVPLENLLKKEDISFNLKADINLDKIN